MSEAPGAPVGVWYAALIGGVLLIAAAVYIYVLQQQRDAWRQAADQLTIGQDLLRADRDEVLQKAREREAALSVLEVTNEEDRARLARLEEQRDRLQGEVLRLTETLAETRERADGRASEAEQSPEIERLERERAEGRAELERLQADLAERDEALAEGVKALDAGKTKIEAMVAETADLHAEKSDLNDKVASLEEQVAAYREGGRQRQILRGHRASLGDVKPYIAEVGPGDWRVIEDWLARQLGRPMAVPDLTDRGWSYEGARLLGAVDGPPMAMLLYADDEGRPISLTVARDSRGERDLVASAIGGLNLLDWREERHAFILAGETVVEVLRPVALALQSAPPAQSEDAVVPTSRYVRPAFRPTSP